MVSAVLVTLQGEYNIRVYSEQNVQILILFVHFARLRVC